MDNEQLTSQHCKSNRKIYLTNNNIDNDYNYNKIELNKDKRKENENIELKNALEDGAKNSKTKQVLLGHEQRTKFKSNEKKGIVQTNCVYTCTHSDKIEQQFKQQQERACVSYAQNLLYFNNNKNNSTSVYNNTDQQFNQNGLNVNSVDVNLNNVPFSALDNKNSNNRLSDLINNLNDENKLDHHISKCDDYLIKSDKSRKTVKRIGVFYSDLCEVVKNMRSFSSHSNSSSFKSDKPDKENLLSNNLNDCSIKTMVKTPLNQQKIDSQQQNGLNQRQTNQPITSNTSIKINTQLKKPQSFLKVDKMNEQLITKDKKSFSKGSSDQNLFKQLHNSQLLQVPINSSDQTTNQTQTNFINATNDEVDAFRFLNTNQQSNNNLSNTVSTISVNEGNSNISNNLINSTINRQNNQHLPDLLHNHVPPPPAYSTLPNCLTNGLTHLSNGLINDQSTLNSRQMARLHQQQFQNNLITPLTLNIARSRNSTALLTSASSAPLSPNNLFTNTPARIHQPLSNSASCFDNYRNPLNNQLTTVPINSTTTSTNQQSATITQLPTATTIPPHVHHRFGFPLNANRFVTNSSGHFLSSDLDAITQSKSCLSCTSISLRWGIFLIAFIGLLSTIVGACLFAVRPSGRDSFTLAFILLGVGIVLIISSIVWKINSEPLDDPTLPHLNNIHTVTASCTTFYPTTRSQQTSDPENLNIYLTNQSGQFKIRLTRFYHQIANLFCCTHHSLNSPAFGNSINASLSGPAGASSTGNLLGEPSSLTNINSTNTIYGHHHRRFLPRLPNSSGRSNAHHPYGSMSMFYPEFPYQTPPPSYQASNQEYRLRMLLYERANTLNTNNLDINSNLNTTSTTTGTNNNSNNTINSNLANNSTNNSNNNNQSSNNSGTFSGLLSNLGNFVSNSFSTTNNNLATLSPPPTYRSGSTLAGALCRSLAFYNSSTRNLSRPPSYRSSVNDQANRNNSNTNRTNDLTNSQLNQDSKHFSTSQKKKTTVQEENLKEETNIHRVTIHQTNTSSSVCTNGINIVAINQSVNNNLNGNNQINSSDNRNRTNNENEVQILAHL